MLAKKSCAKHNCTEKGASEMLMKLIPDQLSFVASRFRQATTPARAPLVGSSENNNNTNV
jgi:hypothetical protein